MISLMIRQYALPWSRGWAFLSCLCLLTAVVYSPVLGQQGYPLTESFRPVDVLPPAEGETFTGYTCIAQSSDGFLYLGYENQIIEFDGQNTRELDMPEQVLSLLIGQDGRLYAGLTNDLGVIEQDARGSLSYRSLLVDIGLPDSAYFGISRIFQLGKEIAFYSDKFIFTYRPGGKVRMLPAVGDGYRGSFTVSGSLMVFTADKKLHQLTAEGLDLVSASGDVPDEPILYSTYYNKTQVLIGTASGKLYLTDGGRFKRFAADERKLGPELEIVDARVVGKYVVLASNRYGCVLLERIGGGVSGQLSIESGLPENTVRGLLIDRDESLWVLQSQGLARVYMNLPLEDFRHITGLKGNVNQLVTDGVELYASTESGLYFLKGQRTLQARMVAQTYKVTLPSSRQAKPNASKTSVVNALQMAIASKLKSKTGKSTAKPTTDNTILSRLRQQTSTRYVLSLGESQNSLVDIVYQFEKVLGVNERCLDLKRLQGGGILACTGTSVYEVRNGRLEATLNLNVSQLEPSARYPGTVYASSANHIRVLTRRGDGWAVILSLTDALTNIQAMAEDASGNLWVGTASQLLKYSLEERLVNQPRVQKVALKTAEGGVRVYRRGSWIFALTSNHLVRINPITGAQATATLPTLRLKGDVPFAILEDGSVYTLQLNRRDSLNYLYRCKIAKDGRFTVDTLRHLRLLQEKMDYLRADADGSLWVAGQGRIIHLPTPNRMQTTMKRKLFVRFNRVSYTGGSARDSLLTLDTKNDLSHGQYIFQLLFGAPSFDNPSRLIYQYRLSEDGPWAELRAAELDHYTDEYGDVQFHIRVQDAFGNTSPETVFRSYIAPPFYLRWYFILLFLIAAGASAVGIVRYRERAIREQKAQLEIEVAHRTEEVNTQNKQLLDKNNELEHQRKTILAQQDQLIQSEKMAVLGQIVANVAHEINNALAAIRTSGQLLEKDLPTVLEVLPGLLSRLSPDLQKRLYRLFDLASKPPPTLSTAEKRDVRDEVESQLLKQGVGNADRHSQQIVDNGLTEHTEEIIPLLLTVNGNDLMQMVYSVGSLLRCIASIRVSSERTQKIVYTLKSQSHFNLEEKAEPVNIGQLLDNVLQLQKHQLSGIDVVHMFEPDIPEIPGYADELAQVWTNLIVNAVHAMNGKGRLEISLKKTATSIEVGIGDNGTGIPPEVLPRIFDAFFTTKPKGIGTGQGLPICRRILERHNGTLTVESELGRTVFTATMPLMGASVAHPIASFSQPNTN
jgi:signal transduction histidine kinase